MKNYFKYASLTVFLLMTILSMSSCGTPAPPTQDSIIKDLPEELLSVVIWFENELDGELRKLNVNSLKIDRRQTSKDSDAVYCTVELEDDCYHFTKYIVLNYKYYNQTGWSLDGFDYTSESESYVVGDPVKEYGETRGSILTNDGKEATFCGSEVDESDKGIARLIYRYEDNALLSDSVHKEVLTYQYESKGDSDAFWVLAYDEDEIENITWHANGTAWTFWALSTATWSFIIDKIDFEANEVSIRYYESAFGENFSKMNSIVVPIDSIEDNQINLNEATITSHMNPGRYEFSDLRITGNAFEYYGPASWETDKWREMNFRGYT